MGSSEHPLSSLSIEGSVSADGESFKGTSGKANYAIADGLNGGPGGGSGGSILLFLHTLALGEPAVLSSTGGSGGPNGCGGGGGGRIHFHWSDIPTGDVYQPIATVKGSIQARFVHSIQMVHISVYSCEFSGFLYFMKRKHLVFTSACSFRL